MGHSIQLQANNKSISPKYRVSDWCDARQSDDWATMVAIFRDRLNGRFLEPIELIEKDNNIGEFAGFSIMSLDCLLVETLNQFYQGWDETPGNHQRQFWKFFRESEYFKPNFTRRMSDIFYSHVRCGLLHQAQTKKRTLIRADQDRMISPSPGGLVNGIIVDRIRFHDALKQEVSAYSRRLEAGRPSDANLRQNFITKMQYICGEQA
ncbi:MAG: hypothetical protein JJT90_19120 [Ectothiorhodospiraceae bacterium]|nr:hypothetical protein [Ectothiorhodospiraceae bacterium]